MILLQFSLSLWVKRQNKTPFGGFWRKLRGRDVSSLPYFSAGLWGLSWSCSVSGYLCTSLPQQACQSHGLYGAVFLTSGRIGLAYYQEWLKGDTFWEVSACCGKEECSIRSEARKIRRGPEEGVRDRPGTDAWGKRRPQGPGSGRP